MAAICDGKCACHEMSRNRSTIKFMLLFFKKVYNMCQFPKSGNDKGNVSHYRVQDFFTLDANIFTQVFV